MVLKLCMWGSLVFFRNGSPLQFASSVLLSVLQLCIQIKLQPFKNDDVNNMQLLSLILGVITSVISLCFRYIMVVLDSKRIQPKDIILYNSSKDILGVLIIIVTLFSYCFFIYKLSIHYHDNIKKFYASCKQYILNKKRKDKYFIMTKNKLELKIHTNSELKIHSNPMISQNEKISNEML